MELYTLTIESLKPVEDNWTSSAQYMPLPEIYSQHSIENGGNVLGLDRNSNTLVGEYFFSFDFVLKTLN